MLGPCNDPTCPGGRSTVTPLFSDAARQAGHVLLDTLMAVDDSDAAADDGDALELAFDRR
jgi:hypothetical protein